MEICEKVNFKLVPVKLHYFLYFGAQAGILPFLSIIAGQLGISVAGVGVIFTILPFVSLAAKPFFGGIADHLQKLKLILLIFITVSTASFLSMNFIPRLDSYKMHAGMDAKIFCTTNSSYLQTVEASCELCVINRLQDNYTSCVVDCQPCSDFNWTKENDTFQFIPSLDIAICHEKHYQLSVQLVNYTEAFDIDWKLGITNASWNHTEIQTLCLTDQVFHCNLQCNTEFHDCFTQYQTQNHSIYTTFQFWLFFILIMFAWVSAGVITSLSDAACYEVLEGRCELYGKQRLWGTVGWGTFSLFTGYLNDLITGDAPVKDYSASFYMLAALMLFDFLTIARSDIKTAKLSRTSLKNVCVLFARIQVVVFIITVFIIGGLTGLHWTYFFWYMNDLKSDQLIMGLALGIESFLGELPFFFFAGKIISKIGHVNAINLTLLFFSIRYILYSFIHNPWLVLPVELTQGLTFGIFYAAMTSYAKFVAPSGSEATMQGLLGGMFEGLGIATGGLLGGLSISHFGSHGTFRIAGVIALLCCVFHITFSIIVSCRDKMLHKEEHLEDDRIATENTSFIS